MFSTCLVKLHSTCPEKDFADKYLYRKKSYFHPFRTLRGNFSVFWGENFRQGCQNWILRAQKNNLRIFFVEKVSLSSISGIEQKNVTLPIKFFRWAFGENLFFKKIIFFHFWTLSQKTARLARYLGMVIKTAFYVSRRQLKIFQNFSKTWTSFTGVVV